MEGRTLLKVQMGKREQGDGTWCPGHEYHPSGPARSRKWTGRGPTPAWGRRQRRLEGNGCVAMGQAAGCGWCDPGRPQEGPQEGIGLGVRRAALGAAHLSSRGSVTPSLPCISVGTADHTLPPPLALLPTALPERAWPGEGSAVASSLVAAGGGGEACRQPG